MLAVGGVGLHQRHGPRDTEERCRRNPERVAEPVRAQHHAQGDGKPQRDREQPQDAQQPQRPQEGDDDDQDVEPVCHEVAAALGREIRLQSQLGREGGPEEPAQGLQTEEHGRGQDEDARQQEDGEEGGRQDEHRPSRPALDSRQPIRVPARPHGYVSSERLDCHRVGSGARLVSMNSYATRSRYRSLFPAIPSATDPIWSIVSSGRTLWRPVNSPT